MLLLWSPLATHPCILAYLLSHSLFSEGTALILSNLSLERLLCLKLLQSALPAQFLLFFFVLFCFVLFFKFYIIVLVLSNIKMSPPQVYMCSWSLSLCKVVTPSGGFPSWVRQSAQLPPRFLLFLSITALDNAAWSFYISWLLSTLFINYCQQGPRPGVAIYWALPCVPGAVFGTSHISYNLETLFFLIQIRTGICLKNRSCDSQRQSWNLDKGSWFQTSIGHSAQYTFYWSIVALQCWATFWCTA